jgi:nickel/cobalt transporter (NiCoT) family protein
MSVGLSRLFNDKDENVRGKAIGIYLLLTGANVAAWGWAVIAFCNYPVILRTALLAYSFGLWHAFDADHIAAIDNVTRKLMQDARSPVGVGLFFSLGHSTTVGLSAARAITATAPRTGFDTFRNVGTGGAGLSPASAIRAFTRRKPASAPP